MISLLYRYALQHKIQIKHQSEQKPFFAEPASD